MRILRPSFALGLLAALASSAALSAQCAEAQLGSAIGNGDDVVLPMQALGFPFSLGASTFTHVHPSTNGFVYLSNNGSPTPGGPLCCDGDATDLVAGAPKIAAFWADLDIEAGVGNVKFNALPGKAVITWENAKELGNDQTFTVQMQLLASGEIYLTWSGDCQIRDNHDFLVGVSEGGGAAVPTASDYATAGSSASTTSFELFVGNGAFDLGDQALLLVPSGTGYAWVPLPCPRASHRAYGNGCYASSNSFYQLTTVPAVSSATLSNTSITMVPTGGQYVVVAGGTYVAPTGAATLLTLTDDGTATSPTLSAPFPFPGGTTSALTICANGSVWAAPGNDDDYEPNVATMLNANTQTGWYSWHDYNPSAAGSGRVKFEQVGGIAYVTWDGVYNYGGTTAADANTFQFQFDTATGQVVIVWLGMSANPHVGIYPEGEPHLVGYSPGAASLDIGSQPFATSLPIQTSAIEGTAMLLSAAPAPLSTASTGSTVVYTTADIDEFAPGSGVYIALNILSIGQLNPGIDLGVIGAPGCRVFVASFDFLQSMVGATPTNTVSLTLPAGLPSGVSIHGQSVALVAPGSLNAFGLTTSNGITSTISIW